MAIRVPELSAERLVRPRTNGPGLDVFAVEPTAAQIVWSRSRPGPVHLEVAGRRLTLEGGGGPHAVVVEDLAPGTEHRARLVEVDGRERTTTFRTPTPPPGAVLFRFATLNDLHLGRGEHGLHGHLPHGDEEAASHPFRCARAALDEAVAWGAQLIVVKGDICDETTDWTWSQAARLFRSVEVPLVLLPGNHDTGRLREFEPEEGARAHGLDLVRGVAHLDVPGLRLLLVDSCRPGNGWGAVARHAEQCADLAAGADGGVFVATHHQPQALPVPTYWPHGIPSADARRFARAVTAANPAALASSGHTHRCRRRQVGGLVWTEVAATNHFPGVWAGYTVHEGGIAQVVRRIAAPDELAWTEHTRNVLGGAWALWSTGSPADRCFSLTWPR